MRALTLPSGTALRLYQSIFELPAGRHLEFQHWLLREAGIGSGAADVERHFSQVLALLGAKRPEEAADALMLLYQAHVDTLDKFSPRQLAFAVLVADLNDRPCTDFTEDGLQRVLQYLSAAGLTEGMVAEEVATIKKDLRRN